MDLLQVLDCSQKELLPVLRFIKRGIFPIIQIGIPIILILMGSIDLGKAVLSSDDKEIKGAVSKLVKRAIAAVAVFFMATIVYLLMGMFTTTGSKSGTNVDSKIKGSDSWKDCWEAAG